MSMESWITFQGLLSLLLDLLRILKGVHFPLRKTIWFLLQAKISPVSSVHPSPWCHKVLLLKVGPSLLARHCGMWLLPQFNVQVSMVRWWRVTSWQTPFSQCCDQQRMTLTGPPRGRHVVLSPFHHTHPFSSKSHQKSYDTSLRPAQVFVFHRLQNHCHSSPREPTREASALSLSTVKIQQLLSFLSQTTDPSFHALS